MLGAGGTSIALLTANEAASLLKISPSTVRRMARTSRLQAVPPSGEPLRFALADVLALAHARQTMPLTTDRHVCLFVRTPEQFTPALLALIGEPLATDATVVLALDRAETRLERVLTDSAARRAHTEGRLHMLEAEAVYMSGGHYDASGLFDRLADLSADVAVAGRPLVFVGEMAWAVRQRSGAELARCERDLHRLLSEQPNLTLVCVYDASRFDGEATLAALQAHPVAWIDGVRRAGLLSREQGGC